MWFLLLSSVQLQLQLLHRIMGGSRNPYGSAYIGNWVGLDRCHQPPVGSEITVRVLLGTAL